MKVLFVTSGLSYHHGGSAFSEGALIQALQKHVSVTVLVEEGRLEEGFKKDHELKDARNFRRLETVKAFFQKKHWIRKLIQESSICHFNGHWKWHYFFLTRICKQLNVPYLLHPRGMLFIGHRKKWIKPIFNFFLGSSIVRDADKVIALSHYEVNQFRPYHLKSSSVEVIPNGIPVPHLSHPTRPTLPAGVESYFLYIGRIESRKNLLFLVDAFKVFLDKGGKSALLIVGPVEYGYDVEVRARIASQGVGRKVFILKPMYKGEKESLLHFSKGVVYPTFDEPYGRVPFEAIGCLSYPVIPDESGSAEYIQPFLPQCIYQHQNKRSLADVLYRLECVRGKETDLSLKKAKDWVEEALDWSKISEQVLRVYHSLDTKSPKNTSPPVFYKTEGENQETNYMS